MEHATMHAKTAVIDGVFSTVGSSNLDWRSLVANSELDVIILGDDFGQQLEALFARDRAASVPIEPTQWQQRGVKQRALEWVGRAAERLL
jgi:cardiolipin synthase